MQDVVDVKNRETLNPQNHIRFSQQKENEVLMVKNTISSSLVFPNISSR